MSVTLKNRGENVFGDVTVLDDLTVADDATITGDVVIAGDFTLGESGTGSDFTVWSDVANYKVWFDADGDTRGAWYFGANTYGILTQWYGDTTGYYVQFDPSGDTNGAFYFGADTKGIQVNLYGDVTGCGVFWDPTTDTNGTLTIGGTGGSKGNDVVIYGVTSGSYAKWDQSADDLILNAACLVFTGTSVSTIDLSGGTSTTDIILSNSATLVNTSNVLTIEEATITADASTLFGVESANIRLGVSSSIYMDIAVTDTTGVVAITHTGNDKKVTWTTTGGFDFVGAIALDATTVSGVLSVTDATEASALTTASLKTAGGLAVTKDVWIGGGQINLTTVASDIVVIANTAVALEFDDGTTKFIAIDTQIDTDDVSNITITGMPATYAAAAGNTHMLLNLAPGTTTLTGNVASPTAMEGLALYIAQPIVTDSDAITIGRASTVYIASSPGAADAASMTVSAALRIGTCTTAIDIGDCDAAINLAGTATEGITFTGTATNNAIQIGGTYDHGIYFTVDPVAGDTTNSFINIGDYGTAIAVAPTSAHMFGEMHNVSLTDVNVSYYYQAKYTKITTSGTTTNTSIAGHALRMQVGSDLGAVYGVQAHTNVTATAAVPGEVISVSAFTSLATGLTLTTGRVCALQAMISNPGGTGTFTAASHAAYVVVAENAVVDEALKVFTQSTTTVTDVVNIENDGTCTTMLKIDNDGTAATGIAFEGALTDGIVFGGTVADEVIQIGGTYDHGIRFTEDPVAGDSDNSFINIGDYGTAIAVAPTSDNMFGTMHNVTMTDVDVAYWYQAHYTKITTSGTTDATSIAGHALRMTVGSDLGAVYGIQSHVTLSGARTFTSEVTPGSFYLDVGTGSVSSAGSRVNALQAVITGGATVTADIYAVAHFYAATNATPSTLLAVQQNSTVTSTSAIKIDIDGTNTYAFDFAGTVPDAWTTGTAGTGINPNAEYVLIPVDVAGTTNPLFILAAQTWSVT